MPLISLTTEIRAPIETVFDLSRSIDLHMHSVSHTNERAVAGVTSGLIEQGQEVTWRARHFGIWWTLTSEITLVEPPHRFADRMKEGPFKRFDHLHQYEFQNGITIMKDRFDYESPFGIIGCMVDVLFMKRYMTSLLVRRNQAIKTVAETDPESFLKSGA